MISNDKMKSNAAIKKRIEELKDYRDKRRFSPTTRGKYNGIIHELEWVLDEE